MISVVLIDAVVVPGIKLNADAVPDSGITDAAARTADVIGIRLDHENQTVRPLPVDIKYPLRIGDLKGKGGAE